MQKVNIGSGNRVHDRWRSHLRWIVLLFSLSFYETWELQLCLFRNANQ